MNEEKKLTDEEILKALECCVIGNCKDCSYRTGKIACKMRKLIKDAIGLIRALKAKIEQGTLVDVEAYFIVEENQWAGKNRFLVCRKGVHLFVCDFFETREEAEKRLKEIRNA